MRNSGFTGVEQSPGFILRLLDNDLTLLFARLCVVAPFLVSGVIKLTDWSAGTAEMAAVGLQPSWLFNLAALIVEIGGSLLVVINRKVWLGAGALGVFTVLTTLLAHRFWEFAEPVRTMQMNSFLEHMTIAAAFILVVVVGARQR